MTETTSNVVPAAQGVPEAFSAQPPQSTAVVNAPTGTFNTTTSPTLTINGPTTTTNGNHFFTADDLTKARQQEKDKLYPTIQELKEQVTSLTADRDERLAAAEAARLAAEEAARLEAEKEMSARDLLEQRTREWEERFSSLERERAEQAALLEREREFAALESYKAQAISANVENIHPDLLDLVSGNSREEIDASIAGLVARTARIIEGVQQAVTGQPQIATPGARVTAPSAGPMDTYTEQRSFSADDIRTMDAQTYAKHRESLLGTASANRNRGLFG